MHQTNRLSDYWANGLSSYERTRSGWGLELALGSDIAHYVGLSLLDLRGLGKRSGTSLDMEDAEKNLLDFPQVQQLVW